MYVEYKFVLIRYECAFTFHTNNHHLQVIEDDKLTILVLYSIKDNQIFFLPLYEVQLLNNKLNMLIVRLGLIIEDDLHTMAFDMLTSH